MAQHHGGTIRVAEGLRPSRMAGAARLRGQSGVTLVELLIAATISVLLGAMLIGVWAALTNSYAYSTRSSESRDLAR
ncbi:MAG TPA: prepilin-type N-terminal cleavage/methylation domain-containing protein, partial [Thermoleophilia bacterium]|nr:prepilin-type N-terminal cleavage/methylation domain-containing protein [Thermoleophilia bacterium]